MRLADKYISGTDIITVAQAANLLADKLELNATRVVRYRRVYRAIERAISDGHLKCLKHQKTINAGAFFVWAKEKFGWDSAYYIKKLSVSVSVNVTGVSARGIIGNDVTAHSLPSNPRAREKETLHQLHQAELNKRELERLRGKLETIEKQKAERSQRAREAGGQGGRGKAR